MVFFCHHIYQRKPEKTRRLQRRVAGFPQPLPVPAGHSNTEAVGMALFTDFLLPFEIAAAILTVALIAAIASGSTAVVAAWSKYTRAEVTAPSLDRPAGAVRSATLTPGRRPGRS